MVFCTEIPVKLAVSRSLGEMEVRALQRNSHDVIIGIRLDRMARLVSRTDGCALSSTCSDYLADGRALKGLRIGTSSSCLCGRHSRCGGDFRHTILEGSLPPYCGPDLPKIIVRQRPSGCKRSTRMSKPGLACRLRIFFDYLADNQMMKDWSLPLWPASAKRT